MSPRGSISANHVWKRFRPDRRRSLFRDELERWRNRGLRMPWTWALSDVDVRVVPGESVALLGANGSGKSTMLKILNRVMYPYAGTVEAAGRIGAMIEVASGIHPDLTGRENCFLFGSILGLSRAGVGARFDAIVEFAELGDAIDRQVKFYSSGMKMRLGFGIAAFLEPDILLVDEVLAVGDAHFQQRCLDRMRQVLQAGTTLVYVSHDLPTVAAMTKRSIWLNEGVVEADGPTSEVLQAYRRWVESRERAVPKPTHDQGLRASLAAESQAPPRSGESLEVTLEIRTNWQGTGIVHLGITQGPGMPLLYAQRELRLRGGIEVSTCRFEQLPLEAGGYAIWAGVTGGGGEEILPWQPLMDFSLEGERGPWPPQGIVRPAPIQVATSWTSPP